jgi:hypothetical protein
LGILFLQVMQEIRDIRKILVSMGSYRIVAENDLRIENLSQPTVKGSRCNNVYRRVTQLNSRFQ